MPKKFFIFFFIASLFFAAPVFAQDFGLTPTQQAAGLPTTIAGSNSIPTIIGNIVSIGLGLVGVAFFLLCLYAGFIWMSAMGNTEQAEKAKNILEAAIIGLVLVLAAYAISNFVFSKLGPGGAPQTSAQNTTGGIVAHGTRTDPLVTCDGTSATEGKHCGDNSYCLQGTCIDQCTYDEVGTCYNAPQVCASGNTVAGMCPGNSFCCKP